MFDYVIVGAGSAGCVLANRLSEDPDVCVLLLEAGPRDSRPEIQIPAAFSRLFKSNIDWAYETEPQSHVADRALFWPRGKVLGGSSSINAMIYIRGNRADYDEWAASGCMGWGYEDVLPYFKRSEDNVWGSSKSHGVGGPLRVENLRNPNRLSEVFVEAATQAGLPRNEDFNGPIQEGVGLYQVTQRSGRRVSAASAFLLPVIGRPNLTVETGAQVTRIMFEDRRAVGVAYLKEGKPKRAQANREVMLCGGTVNSPQLLMLSGVGPADHLRKHGIDVVADRKGVGENLQDHLVAGVRYRSKRSGTLLSAESPFSIAQYLLLRKGMLTSNVAEAGAFVHTRSDGAPDLQFHVAPVLFENHGLDRPREHGFSLGPTLVRPLSRGFIRLRDADPFSSPLINPNYLSEQADLERLVAGIRLSREIVAQSAYDAYRGEELTPGASLRSDLELVSYLRETVETLYHPAGTCRMGADAEAVVDLNLQVKGVEGLRVVDASVMPQVINGNTAAPTMMIAEKAADLIRSSVTEVSESVQLEASRPVR